MFGAQMLAYLSGVFLPQTIIRVDQNTVCRYKHANILDFYREQLGSSFLAFNSGCFCFTWSFLPEAIIRIDHEYRVSMQICTYYGLLQGATWCSISCF